MKLIKHRNEGDFVPHGLSLTVTARGTRWYRLRVGSVCVRLVLDGKRSFVSCGRTA